MMIGGIEVHEMHGGRVVRLADVMALPIGAEFEAWIRGQTCLLHAGEPWVYLNDWRRFLRQHGHQDWPRADPAELERFDPDSKICVMNCGPAAGDPRSAAERKLLCDDCEPAQRRPIPQAITPTMLALAMSEDGEGFDEDDFEFPGEFEDF